MAKESKIIISVLILIIVVLGFLVLKKEPKISNVDNIPKATVPVIPITISKENIKEDNFTGTRSVIKGSALLAKNANLYIDQTIESFKKSADEEVPEMRKQFGVDSPTSNYEINIEAIYTKSLKTESIIINEYIYTGGANGNSSYKVFTSSISSGEILNLSDVIKSDKQDAFVVFIKKRLMDWRPDGSEGQVTFEEEVKNLTFESFINWSFDKSNLIIYFDKYQIGPGVLGAVIFPIPLSSIKTFLVEN